MTPNPGGDEIGEAGVTRFIKGRSDSGEHLLANRAELAVCGLKGQLLNLGFADIAWLVFDHRRLWGGVGFCENCFIHRMPIYHIGIFCQVWCF